LLKSIGPGNENGARFDITGKYRYSLWREWRPGGKQVAFILLNPNRADAVRDDPTIRRCIGFARSWGCGSVEVVNLFAFRTGDPLHLRNTPEPVGSANDRYLLRAARRAWKVVAGWGNHGGLRDRDRQVLRLLENRIGLYCLGITRKRQPRHPLYARGDLPLIRFRPSDIADPKE
jgi:hypothetical protein